MKIRNFFTLLFLGGIYYLAEFTMLFAQSLDMDSVVFSFKYIDSKKYTVESFNHQTVTDNGVVVSKDAKLKNHISFEVQSAFNDSFYIFQTTEFTEDGHLRYEEKSEYHQTRRGITTVAPQYTTPLIRNIPRFQTRAIRVNEQWQALGTDSIQVPIVDIVQKVPVNVTYVYTGTQNIPKSLYTQFISFDRGSRSEDEDHNTYVTLTKKHPAFTARYAIENYGFVDEVQKDAWNIEGSFFITIWWHVEYGRPVFSHEKYSVRITNKTASRVFTFSGTSFAYIKAVVEIERENEVKAIQKELENTSLHVEVTSNEKGIIIRLPHIKFHPDSATLLENEEQKLHVISKVLKKYPKRRVLIEGHTARAGTESSRKKLSIKRAKVIKDVLQTQVGDERDMLFRGWGAEKPLAPHTSEENKQKNRRVEITILEN